MAKLRLRLDELIKAKEAALERELTHKEISQVTGVTESSISRYRHGYVRRFDGDIMLAFANYFEVDFNTMFEVMEN